MIDSHINTGADLLEDNLLDQELADTLTAISVIAKRLAAKLRSASPQEENSKKGGLANE